MKELCATCCCQAGLYLHLPLQARPALNILQRLLSLPVRDCTTRTELCTCSALGTRPVAWCHEAVSGLSLGTAALSWHLFY